MFCEKCGAQIPDIAKFCAGCGAPVEGQPAPRRKISRNQWVDQVGKTEAAKQIKWMKILSYTMAALLTVLYVLATVGLVRIAVIFDKLSNGAIWAGTTPVLVMYSFFGVLAILFGILGAKKYRTGFSVAFLIFGEFSFLFSMAMLFGSGLQNLLWMALAAVPFGLIISMQVKINRKYKLFLRG